jgi:hypothetical protein
MLSPTHMCVYVCVNPTKLMLISTTNNTICKSHAVPKAISITNIRRNFKRYQGNADIKLFNSVKPIRKPVSLAIVKAKQIELGLCVGTSSKL